MNGTDVGEWRAAVHANGRTYYWRVGSDSTTWEKPAELQAVEQALLNTPWRQAKHDNRFYYYNAETKATSWQIPPEVRERMASQTPLPPRPAPPVFAAPTGPAASFAPTGPAESMRSRDRDRDRDREDYRYADRSERLSGFGINAMIPAQNDYELATPEQAEAAFFKALRRAGTQVDWTWQQAMKATVKEAEYHAIKDPKDRKAAFEKYVSELRIQEREREQERKAKVRAEFITMLKRHPEIQYYTRWKTARPILENETIFRSTTDEDERVRLFNEYRNDLYKQWLQSEAANREAAVAGLQDILASLQLQPYTRWADAQDAIAQNDNFQSDPKYRSLYQSDILNAFESHIKELERAFNHQVQQQKALKLRKARRNRDDFKHLLRDLKAAGKLRPGTKWSQIQPLIEDDKRYKAMLGQQGSTPLELFWDMMEEEERELKVHRMTVITIIEDKRFDIRPSTSLDEFMSVMQTDRRAAQIDRDTLAIIFNRLRERATSSKSISRAIDALRSIIKHLDPPVALSDSWDQVRSRVQNTDEYRALESDEQRRSAFEKHLRRLREKEDEKNRDHSRRRDRDADRERDRDRDRDRDHRNGHRAHRRTRTPEFDAYEADRKKAQAERERTYRNASSMAGLSPPPMSRRDHRDRERDRDRDRDRDGDRYEPPRSRQVSSYYDRERRERDVDRERAYISRADPRDRSSELDYGDGGGSGLGGPSRASSYRRRRESEGDSPRSTKRARRSRTPTVVPKEDPGLKSGSEEGEIEET